MRVLFFSPKSVSIYPPKSYFHFFFLKPRCEKWKFVMKPWSQSVHFLKLLWEHEIFGPVLWKKWGFSRNLTYFYFLLWPSFTWNWRKNGGFFFTISWHQKWNWLMVSWFYGAKIMKPSRVPRAVNFIFFPTNFGGFIILCPLKLWNHQPVSFLMPK